MAAPLVSSMSLKPSPFIERSAIKNLPSLSRPPFSLEVQAGSGKKIKTASPYGPGGGLILKDGLDASGRRAKGKGVYQFVDKYGANVDGYSPIYTPEEWSPSGDVYVGGNAGLLIWAITLGGSSTRWCPPCLQHKCFGSVERMFHDLPCCYVNGYYMYGMYE